MDNLYGAMTVSAAGMKSQGARIKIISENVANSGTAAISPDSDPYTRKTISFKNEMDRNTGIDLVRVHQIRQHNKEPFPTKFMPDHPGADVNGLVRMPNVDPLIELADMREAQRTYEANLGMMEQSKNMILQTIELLR